MENILSPWKDGEEKLCALNVIIKYDVDINDVRDYVENTIRGKDNIPKTVKEAIFNSIAVRSTAAERASL
jgi:hypothetical protein